jgi:type I restriction enzyme M protein
VTDATLPAIEASSGWQKLSELDRKALVDRLSGLDGNSTTDRVELARQLGPLPKAIEKPTWEALAIRDPEAPAVTDRKGKPEADPELRDNENVPLLGRVDGFDEDTSARLASAPYRGAVEAYLVAEVLPFAPDASVDHTKTKIGYEIPLTRHFYRYVPPRPLVEIDAEIRSLEADIQRLIGEVTA